MKISFQHLKKPHISAATIWFSFLGAPAMAVYMSPTAAEVENGEKHFLK
jgi:hypothetical protein